VNSMSPEQMKVAVYDGRGGLQLQAGPVPDLVPGGAMLRIRACGIAISDLRAYKAKRTQRLLHKLAGEIVGVAPDVSGLNVGDRVYISDHYHCGNCSSCNRGFSNLCERPTNILDERQALSEKVLLPAKFLQSEGATRVAREVSFEDATQVGPLADCLNTLRAVEFEPGASAVVLGVGPMGLLHVLLLKVSGASRIIVCDVDEIRLRISKNFGADHTINPHSTDAVGEVRKLTGGGADVVIVATGKPDAMLDSIKMARSRGRIDFFGGLALEPSDTTLKVDAHPIHYRELKIVGTYSHLLDDSRVAAELIGTRRLSPSGLNTHHFDFNHLQDAFTVVDDPKALRVMITV
jgi:L-iditol 2-dehydrogenase